MPNEYASGFPGSEKSVSEAVSDSAARVQQQAAEYGKKATEYGKKAVEAIDARRGTAASGLDKAAAGLHSQADELPGGSSVSAFAHSTADRMSSTADYLRDHDVNDMASDVQKFVKAYPIPAILGAVVLGFIAGRAARS